MTFRITAAALMGAALLAAPALANDEAYSTGMRIAKKRQYADPACYARVFSAHAVKRPDGTWGGPTGRAAQGYKLSLNSTCGISL